MVIATFPVALEWNNAPGGPGVNVWHLRFDANFGDAEAVIAALATFYDDIRGVLPTGTVYRFPDAAIEVGGEHRLFTNDNLASNNGSGGANYLAMPLAMVIGWRTANATRRGRGRTFVGPLATTAQGPDGTPASEAVTLLQNAADDLVENSGDADGAALGVYSPTDGVVRDFTAARVRDVFAVLRSRRA